jgi:hypothetical protein
LLLSCFTIKTTREVKRPWHKAKVLNREAERRLNGTYEVTNSLTGDGVSDRLAGPVKAGKRNTRNPGYEAKVLNRKAERRLMDL